MRMALTITMLAVMVSRGITAAVAQDAFPPDQIKRGAQTFSTFCTTCHGERMSNPDLFNLKEFPRDQRSRFINSVSNGKNAMPPWRGQITPDEIEALWAYVMAGEKNP